MNKSTVPMTEINQLLSGKEGIMHLKKMNEKLDEQLASARKMMNSGLAPKEYQEVAVEMHALHLSKQVLHSLHMYHNQ